MSVLLGRRLCFVHRCLSARHIFSVTGVWNDEINKNVRLAVERHWMQECSAASGELFTNVSPEGASDVTAAVESRRQYVLSMFPYPSGRLHMGHVRVYSIGDCMARFYRLQGYRVLQPIGWDSFGLPAENAALERHLSAAAWTGANVTQMTHQLRRLCLSLDWHCELSTSHSDYYRWTQWLFTQLFSANLAYQKYAQVNWDPVDKTVLADEQVDKEGRSWRSGAVVQRRLLRQWFIRTTRFAHRLRSALDTSAVSGWRDVALLQRHWLGDCKGWKLDLQIVDGHNCRLPGNITVWLSDLRQLRHVDCVLVQRQHPVLYSHTLSDQDAPLSHSISEQLNVCVPCGPDAKSYRQVPLVVYDPSSSSHNVYPAGMTAAVHGLNGDFGGESDAVLSQLYHTRHIESRCSEQSATDFTSVATDEDLGVLLEACRCSSHLHDWLVSRQRYWGTPIPVVHCRLCGAVPVPDHQLPVPLPDVDEVADNSGNSVEQKSRIDLKQFTEWINTTCPKCGGAAQRETDTLDTFVDSSWYYLRYLDPHNSAAAFCPHVVNKCLPVQLYIGGKEHATLHLYYARFVHHFLHVSGLVQCPEPFTRLLSQGQVMGRTFRRADNGQYLSADQVALSGDKAVMKNSPEVAVKTHWQKMSKSKHNGVDPDALLDEYGADTTRLFILANVAPTSERRWSEETFAAQLAWQRRLWLLVGDFLRASSTPASSQDVPQDQELEELERRLRLGRNYHVRSATFSLQQSQAISVAITRLQTFTKELRRVPSSFYTRSAEFQRSLGELIIMLSPVMPCLTAELWTAFVQAADTNLCHFHWDRNVHQQSWPEVDMDGGVFFRVQVGDLMEEFSIPRHQLEKLTVETAGQLAAELCDSCNSELRDRLTSCSLQLDLVPGLGAVLKSVGAVKCDEEGVDFLKKAAAIALDRKRRKNMKREQRKSKKKVRDEMTQ